MRRLIPRRAWIPLLCALLLMGCGQTAVVEAPRLDVPASLLTCPAAPVPPPQGADDTALARWMLDLAAAGDACRATLAAVARVVGP